MRMMNEAKYQDIMAVLVQNKSKCYVIDDAQYLMAFSLFDRVNEVGYKKFTDIGPIRQYMNECKGIKA